MRFLIIALFFVLGLFVSEASAQCRGGSCAIGQARPVRTVLRAQPVRRVVRARPVRSVFAARPLRSVFAIRPLARWGL